MRLAYEAFDAKGIRSAGEIDAGSLPDGTEQLRRKGLFVSTIKPAAGGTSKHSGKARVSMGKGRRLKSLAMFSRQLQVLVTSGTPLVQALMAIERQAEDVRWKSILETLRSRVEEGTPLSEALRLHPEMFDPVSVSLIAAGEASGEMPAMLERLAVLSRKQLQLRNAVLGALIYPCLLVFMGFVVMIVMLMFVLPRFADLFKQLDSPLPPTTKFLMVLSELLLAYWWVLAPVAGAAVVVARYWSTSGAGRETCEDLLLRLPKVGRITRSLLTAQLARMLGNLLESRITLLDALKLTKDAISHSRYRSLIARTEEAVGKGEPISSIFCQSDLISPSVQEAIRTGEQSGSIGLPLLQMADFLDEENDVIVKSLTRLLEPLILVTLGVLVGFIALSVFMPLFDLVSTTQQGGH